MLSRETYDLLLRSKIEKESYILKMEQYNEDPEIINIIRNGIKQDEDLINEHNFLQKAKEIFLKIKEKISINYEIITWIDGANLLILYKQRTNTHPLYSFSYQFDFDAKKGMIGFGKSCNNPPDDVYFEPLIWKIVDFDLTEPTSEIINKLTEEGHSDGQFSSS